MGGMTLNGYYGTHQNMQGLVGYNISLDHIPDYYLFSHKENVSVQVKFFDFLLLRSRIRVHSQIQLNLMEPPHDGYYVNQQNMQGLVC